MTITVPHITTLKLKTDPEDNIYVYVYIYSSTGLKEFCPPEL